MTTHRYDHSDLASACIFGNDVRFDGDDLDRVGVVAIDSRTVRCGVIADDAPAFDPDSEGQRHHVVVRKRAFSCNYRDRAVILHLAELAGDGFSGFGSEFVGDVVAVGADVQHLAAGDRVIGNGSYGDETPPGVRMGLATTFASQRVEVFHAAKLVRVPATMADTDAAGFGLAAQTSVALVRAAARESGQRVLITAARSNTSLAVAQVVRAAGATALGTTRTDASRDDLAAFGYSEVIRLDPADTGPRTAAAVARLTATGGGIDAIIDPFADLFLNTLLPCLRLGGHYATCGIHRQTSAAASAELPAPAVSRLLAILVTNNITLRGNCLGTTGDLMRALELFDRGQLWLPTDSTFRDDAVAEFLHRSFNDPLRFGKVVYEY